MTACGPPALSLAQKVEVKPMRDIEMRTISHYPIAHSFY